MINSDGYATSASMTPRTACTKLSIEFSEFITDEDSPAMYLRQKCGVPFVRLPLPVGLRAMDRLIEVILQNGGTMPQSLIKERGRYLDAMIDSHKYSAEGRAAIYGEPDFVSAITALCCENGIVPVLTATAFAIAKSEADTVGNQQGSI